MNEELKSACDRLVERFGVSEPPPVFLLLPSEVVRDTILNFIRGLDSELKVLDRSSRLLIGLAVSVSRGNSTLSSWLEQAAKIAGKNQEECEAAKAVALTCATYNGYYKLRALTGSTEFDSFQPALRATPFVRSVLSKAFVELICIAVSVQNNCSYCVQGHVKAAKEAGATIAMIDETVRAGAIVGALAAGK